MATDRHQAHGKVWRGEEGDELLDDAIDDRDATPDDPDDKEDRGRAYYADGITVYFNARKCWHTGVCLRGLPEVFKLGRRPWVRADLDTPERTAALIDVCPSKALSYDLKAAEPG